MSSLINLMGQVKKLKNGTVIQHLLDEAYKILGNPIVLFSMEYHLLAHTEIITDDPLWNELITSGTFSKETQIFFANEGFFENLANSKRSSLLKSKELKYDRITGKLFNKHSSYAFNLGLVACNKPLEKYDQVIFDEICKLISKEISENELYQEHEQSHHEAVINSLIDESMNVGLDAAKIESFYNSLKSSLYIVVADVSLCDPEHTRLIYFRDLLKQTEPTYKYAIYNNYIVVIISTNEDVLPVDKELNGLIKIFEQNNIYAGISSRFENLHELKKYYAEAIKSLEYVLKCQCSQRIFPYNAKSIDTLEQIESLESGLGIQYFLNKGFEIFGNPILFHDMEPYLLGCTENVEIADPIWQELVAYGTGSAEMIELFQTAGWVDIMDTTRGGALLVSDKCKYDRISWRIYNTDNIRFGCTSIVNTMKPFSKDELVLFGIFSRKFSKEVKKNESYTNIGQIYSGTVINRLLSERNNDYTFYSEHVGNLYEHLMDNFHLAVIDTARCESSQINLAYFRKLFGHLNTKNRYAFFSKYIIIIISRDTILLNENNELDKLNKIFEQNNIYAGISSCFDNLYNLPKYYKEAVAALKSGMKKTWQHGKNRIFQYDGVNDDS